MAIPHITPGDAGATVERFNSVIDVANNLEKLTQAPDNSEANQVGIGRVEILNPTTNPKFKFISFKGEPGEIPASELQKIANAEQAAQRAEDKAQSVVDRANAGEFDGKDGKPGERGAPGATGSGVSAGMVTYDFTADDWANDSTGFKLTVTNAQHKGGQTNALIVQVVQFEQTTSTTSPLFDVFSVDVDGTITIKSDSKFAGRLLVGGGFLETEDGVARQSIIALESEIGKIDNVINLIRRV